MANKACRIKHGPLAKGHATVEGCCRSTVVANRPALLWGACTRRTTLPAWLPTMNQIPLAPGSAKQHWMQLSNVEHKVERKKKTTLPPKARIGAMLKCFVAMSSEPASCSGQMARRAKFGLFGPQRRPGIRTLTLLTASIRLLHPQGKAKQMSTLPHNRTAMGKKKVSS